MNWPSRNRGLAPIIPRDLMGRRSAGHDEEAGMGSRWGEHPTEQEQREMNRSGPSGRSAGLGAAELDLLRSAPDYDAEEMASVRPLGNWPVSLPAEERIEPPPTPGWMPPNRIEPPARPSFPPVEV